MLRVWGGDAATRGTGGVLCAWDPANGRVAHFALSSLVVLSDLAGLCGCYGPVSVSPPVLSVAVFPGIAADARAVHDFRPFLRSVCAVVLLAWPTLKARVHGARFLGYGIYSSNYYNNVYVY